MINKFSCVLDYNPRMATQTYIWLANLLDQQIEPKQIYIHYTGKVPAEFLDYLKNIRVNLIKISPFDTRNPYCNKLVQLSTFIEQEDFEYVFLMDCDTAVIDLEDLELQKEVYAKVVDFPNPPLDILENIFAKHQFKVKKTTTSFERDNNQVTDWNNCNGGLYIISKSFLKLLTPDWEKYAQWCMDNNELFGENYAKHADQVSFALAMRSLEKKVSHLGIEWNYPIHLNKNMLSEVEPNVIHFHHKIDQGLSIQTIGVNKVDEKINEINSLVYEKILEAEENGFYVQTIPFFNIYKINKKHFRDIKIEALQRAFLKVKRKDILKLLIDTSRQYFGFYTSHYPRVFEYTWLYEQLENETGEVFDLGAGVCPLPIALASKGFKVTTIDSHPKQRRLANKRKWNEWGFLDYSEFNKAITSYNIDFLKFRRKKKFDFIYSISVIEHIPQKSRLKILKNASHLLKKGGKLLFTIDLYPGTNILWNLSEDKEVEPTSEHGTIDTFKKELKRYGFRILEEDIQRGIYESRTDVYYIKVEKDKKPFLNFLISNE